MYVRKVGAIVHDIAMHLLDDPAFYRQVVEQASARMDWYRPEQTVDRLMKELGSG